MLLASTRKVCGLIIILSKSFYCISIYPPGSQESDGGAHTMGKQLPRPVSGNTKILLSACNLIEI